MAAKANEGGPEEASRKVASGGKGKNRAVRRKSDRLIGYVGAFHQCGEQGFTNGAEIIAFDRFHVSMHLDKALDNVRFQENR